MEEVFDYPVVLTSYFVGKWRVSLVLNFHDEGKHEVECWRMYGEVMEF
jgi:hypothetical protein